MFGKGKERYETKRIHDELDIIFRILLWNKLDILSDEVKMDYLQVFKFSYVLNDENMTVQKITYSQEVPEYSEEYTFLMHGEGIEGKIYVVEEDTYCTMLWAEEY